MINYKYKQDIMDTKHPNNTGKPNLKILPLGGLGEVGRNMTILEYGKAILIIDMGLKFPEENMPGIDYIIPDINYLKGKENNIKGIIFTHGHYDHIGAVPYYIKKIGNPPIFATSLTKGIILRRQEDFQRQPKLNITTIKNGNKISLSPFRVEIFRQNHNIPDAIGLFISTPVGNIIYTGDFKFDPTPIYDAPSDIEKLKRFKKRGVLLLMSDSTGAETEGHSLSEKQIMENLEKIFKDCEGRIIAATFGSLINRVQQIISLSEKYGRKVAIDGYTMKNNVEICKKLGYIKSQKHTLIKPNEIAGTPDANLTFLCTGAQGEGSAVLMRMANREYKFLKIKKGDSIIFSSSTVPGNERSVQILKDELYKQGAVVFHYKMMDIHAGGHAQKEELEQIIRTVKPKFFMPIHGHYSMLISHAEIAKTAGIPEKRIITVENGRIININPQKIFVEKKRAESSYIMVDGLGIGDVGAVVLRDRQNLSTDGMFVIVTLIEKATGKVQGSPDIISRGFVYLRESKELLANTRKKVIEIIDRAAGQGGAVNSSYIKDEIRNKIGSFLYAKTQRRPMILPVVIEV